ncbi:Transcription factor RFX3 [Geodia barretti]|nr:Transcription factor RFX3 [Geodia barretti]
MEHQLPKEKLLLLTSLDLVTDYISACDYLLYQGIVDFLIPNVLRPIPGTLTQAIRNFAKSLESWLTGTVHGYSPILVKSKVCSVVAFSQTLRRYTSLNHLAQAARAVLQNPSQISQMLADLNRVDFANVQEQASWVCECEETLVARLEQDFKSTLQQQNSLEQWASWLESVVHTVLEPMPMGPSSPRPPGSFSSSGPSTARW